jgi:hypothetical protein
VHKVTILAFLFGIPVGSALVLIAQAIPESFWSSSFFTTALGAIVGAVIIFGLEANREQEKIIGNLNSCLAFLISHLDFLIKIKRDICIPRDSEINVFLDTLSQNSNQPEKICRILNIIPNPEREFGINLNEISSYIKDQKLTSLFSGLVKLREFLSQIHLIVERLNKKIEFFVEQEPSRELQEKIFGLEQRSGVVDDTFLNFHRELSININHALYCTDNLLKNYHSIAQKNLWMWKRKKLTSFIEIDEEARKLIPSAEDVGEISP